MKRAEELLNPILYMLYDQIFRFKGSLLEVMCGNKVGVYDLDKNKEIVPVEYINIRLSGNKIIAFDGIKEVEYKWK